ncbi:hypothetical protein BcepSauron_151 [Burkholderia phage BcepSauron]|uniref:Uncharacterized protein n=1 Tax=Burkholderia phage BcepSauron TaxID=2530033 RepID=A0A482MKG4_9CAUD|nr:hypothetical protein H1O17_gp151 [Burkholderia phage BcepSauron]QBQ74531.1 hypothetical protein BcepSauron_151 [Burkholderia phage BcepSauron]
MSTKNILNVTVNAGTASAKSQSFTAKEPAVKFLMANGLVRSKARALTNAGVAAETTLVIGSNTFTAQPSTVPAGIAVNTKAPAGTQPINVSAPADAAVVTAKPIPSSPYPFPTGAAPL